MRKLRIRSREFLLLTTLTLLVTAAFAIRTRTASQEFARVQAVHAYQAQLQVDWWQSIIEDRRMRVETATTAADKTALQIDLRNVRAWHAKAVAKAEHHERLAPYYEP
jgi:hypothetical protein